MHSPGENGEDEGEEIHVPHLFDIEVLHALRRIDRLGELPTSRLDAAREALRDLPATRYPHTALRDRIWALRRNLTAYDAAYVALAEALDAPLITTDRPLANAVGHSARVELVE